MNVSLFRIAIYIIFFCIPFKIYSESEEKSVHPRQIYSFSVLDSPFNTQRGSLRTENNSPVPSMNQLLPLTKNAIQNSELFCIFSGSFEEQILTVYCSEVTVTFDIAIFPEVIFARAAPLPFIYASRNTRLASAIFAVDSDCESRAEEDSAFAPYGLF